MIDYGLLGWLGCIREEDNCGKVKSYMTLGSCLNPTPLAPYFSD